MLCVMAIIIAFFAFKVNAGTLRQAIPVDNDEKNDLKRGMKN
jgi:hypothetical protein